MAIKQQVDTALPIEFSEVCEVLYQDLLGTNGRSLSQAFTDANADLANRQFDPLYVGVKDRLSNFRGYPVTNAFVTVVHKRNFNNSRIYPWSDVTNVLAVTTDGDGYGNCVNIAGQAGHTTSHAEDSLNLVSEGYDDWFMPGWTNLQLFYTLRDTINTTALAQGGDVINNEYYCSTEDSATHVKTIDTNFGDVWSIAKADLPSRPWRPIREFNLNYIPSLGDWVGGGIVIKIV